MVEYTVVGHKGHKVNPPQISYKSRSVPNRRKYLITELARLDSICDGLRRDISDASNIPEIRARYRTPKEFGYFIGKTKHKLAVLNVERETVKRQLTRCNLIMENIRCTKS